MKTAAFFQPLSAAKVRCLLCPHHCLLTPGKRGICLTRHNSNGILETQNYCRPSALAIDPVEKKPLYHFYPGSLIYSAGPNGCTFRCPFCQNHEIAQSLLLPQEIPAKNFAERIMSSKTIGIAYTYSEPYIWFETIMDVGSRIREAGLYNVMVSNGYFEPAPLADLLTIVDAMNIDIKSLSSAFYRTACKGDLAPVLRSCEAVKKAGCHLEITNLVIPGVNDSDADITALARWIAAHLGKNTPLHLSRYFPRFKMSCPPTPSPVMLRAHALARQDLDFVYIGNMAGSNQENTLCPRCGVLLIRRTGYAIQIKPHLSIGADTNACCRACGAIIPGQFGPANQTIAVNPLT